MSVRGCVYSTDFEKLKRSVKFASIKIITIGSCKYPILKEVVMTLQHCFVLPRYVGICMM